MKWNQIIMINEKRTIFWNMNFKRISWKNALKAAIMLGWFLNQDANKFTKWDQI
jgi:hypothetical protein